MTTLPRRHFLGWDGPALAAAARWLGDEFGADMEHVVVALPGARASRRLAEHLSRGADPGWRPPRLVTQGQLVDELVRLDRPVADRFVRTLAWERALAALAPHDLTRLARDPGAEDDLRNRLRLAGTVRSLHAELTPENLGFDHLAVSDAIRSADERARWAALAKAQAAYRQVLDQVQVADPHEARHVAIEQGRVELEGRVVLVGVADMTELLHRLLESIADRTDVLVVAPESEAAGFDEWGRLVSDHWRQRELELPIESWHVAEKPVDQADRVIEVFSGWEGRFSAEEITVGVADEEVAPYLERRLADCNVRARLAAGLSLERTRPFRLLRSIARFLDRRSYAELAGLARHPDLEPSLRGNQGLFSVDPVEALDRYYREHLPDRADGKWVKDEKLAPPVASILDALERLCGELADGRKRTLAEWAGLTRTFLLRVYGKTALDRENEEERVLAVALDLCGGALAELEQLPEALDRKVPAPDAIELVLRQLSSETVPPRQAATDEPTMELLGWLELALDDAPGLVVTGFNDGRVPQSIHADPFLPNGVRSELGLADNEARLVRDVYATSVLLHAREEVVFVTGRRSVEGDPLTPSRIAFHVAPDDVAERVRRFVPEEGHPPPATPADLVEATFARPKGKERELDSMSVSSFRTYLQSPYTFYLQHVLRLRTHDDRARELDPLQFGNLGHEVLEWFGRDEVRNSADPKVIGKWLTRAVDRCVAQLYGKSPLPAIVLQAEQLKYRLGIFAKRQAKRRAAGWEIAHVEWRPEGESVPLDVDGTPIAIRGRIDRIDRHPTLGWAVLDYKTGEKASDPDKAHRRRDGSWSDLQLPLYWHLTRELGIEDVPQLGYVAVGKDETQIGFHLVEDWSEDILEAGLTEARRVVRCIREGRFEEMGRRLPYEPLLRAICGEGLIGGEPGDEE